MSFGLTDLNSGENISELLPPGWQDPICLLVQEEIQLRGD